MFTVLGLILRQNPDVIEHAWGIGTGMLCLSIIFTLLLVWGIIVEATT
jgi:hypothetical protein